MKQQHCSNKSYIWIGWWTFTFQLSINMEDKPSKWCKVYENISSGMRSTSGFNAGETENGRKEEKSLISKKITRKEKACTVSSVTRWGYVIWNNIIKWANKANFHLIYPRKKRKFMAQILPPPPQQGEKKDIFDDMQLLTKLLTDRLKHRM